MNLPTGLIFLPVSFRPAQRITALSWAQRTSGVCAVGYTT